MVTKQANNAFQDYVSQAVTYVLHKHHDTYSSLAHKLNFTRSFIRNASSKSEPQHWNAYHLYRIAKAEDVCIDDLYPPFQCNSIGFQKYKKVTGINSKKKCKEFINVITPL